MPGKLIYYDGIWDTQTGHARRRGIKSNVVEQRIYRLGLKPENYDRIFYVGNLKRSLNEKGKPVNWAEQCRRVGLAIGTFEQRLRRGMTHDMAIAIGKESSQWNGGRCIIVDGKPVSYKEYSHMLGYATNVVRDRLKRGMTLRQALLKRKGKHKPKKD